MSILILVPPNLKHFGGKTLKITLISV